MAIVNFDLTTLVNYYNARISASLTSTTPALGATAASNSNSGQAAATPPWYQPPASAQAQDKLALSSDAYFDSKDRNLKSATSTASNAGSLIEALVSSQLSKTSSSATNTALAQDNDKLFALYNALTRLDSITALATKDGTLAGQLPGLDTRFQTGLSQVQSFVSDTNFANLTVLLGKKSPSTTGTAAVPSPKFSYSGATAANDAQVLQPLAGLSASDQFTVSITKAGVTTAVPIDLSQISGPLTIDNVVGYVDQQLKAGGFSSRISRIQTGGSLEDGSATWGISVTPGGGEALALSSPAAKPALYVAGQTGTGTDAQGKLVKLTDLDTSATSQFSRNITPDSGTASAKSTVVDGNGNVYVVGNSTGSFGSELNQGTQDVFLSKYDSVGNLQWTKLLGSADSASAYGLAVDPNNNVVVAGSTTSPLNANAIGGGTDSFVAKYDSSGNQTWVHQVAPVANDSALSVTVGSDGSIYVGGQVNGTIAAGQTNAGGTDAYVTKLSSNGTLQFSRQFGTAGTDSANATAVAGDGNLVVASVQSGHAIVTKYDSSSAAGAALWQVDLGDLGASGTLGSLVVSGDQVYVSGGTDNANLTASGAAAISNSNSGGSDAFVFRLTDGGATATPETVTYVGTGANDRGTGLAVAADGTVYLAGTTGGTFAGQTRSSQNTNNLFAAAIGDDGSVQWTRQYAGVEGQSTGASLALDTQGSSVLDVLGLPRGKISTTQSVDLAAFTTVRPGDYFNMQITTANGTRNARVTVEKGETLRSLALKVNNALLFDGKATSTFASGGHTLKIAVNPGVTVNLIAGAKNLDLLSGLGIAPGLLINDPTPSTASTGTSSTKTAAASSSASQSVGLGLTGGLNLQSNTNALHAHNAIQAALSLLKQTYQKLNNPNAGASTTPSGTAPAYLTSQLASYRTALSIFGSSSSTSTG